MPGDNRQQQRFLAVFQAQIIQNFACCRSLSQQAVNGVYMMLREKPDKFLGLSPFRNYQH